MNDNFIQRHEKKLLFVRTAVFSLLILIAVEAVLRFTEYSYLIREKYGFPQYYFIEDPEMGTDLARGFCCEKHEFADLEYPIFTNQHGCFDDEFSKTDFKEKGYILLVGDSMTWGYVRHGDKWGTAIEELTGKSVAQCAVTGHGTKQELIKAKRIISAIGYPPELIILGYAPVNDFNDDYLLSWSTVIDGYRINRIKEVNIKNGNVTRLSEEEIKEKYRKYREWKDRRKSLLGAIKEQSIILSLIDSAFKKPSKDQEEIRLEKENRMFSTGKFRAHYGYNLFQLYDFRKKYPWIEKAFSEHLDNIIAFQELADKYNSKLLIAITKYKNEQLGTDAYKKLVRTLDAEEINYLSLESAFGEYLEEDEFNKLYWKHDGHWNIEGNNLVGLIISKSIMENLLISTDDRDNKMERIKKKLLDY